MPEMSTCCLLTSRKHTTGFLVESLGSVEGARCWWPPVLLAVRLYSCSEFHVRVGGVKLQPFIVGVGLWQGCVLYPFLFITYMCWISTHSRVNDCVTVGSFRINRLLFTEDFVLLVSSAGVDNMHLIGFLLRATKREWKLALKRLRCYVSPETYTHQCGL